tara:strand:+ start:393 stop:494 length:102 start_codon:yes stop_codon:yes gene_type:complete
MTIKECLECKEFGVAIIAPSGFLSAKAFSISEK